MLRTAFAWPTRLVESAADESGYLQLREGEELVLIRQPGHAGINVEEIGSGGVPVVFVHSLAGNARQWLGQLEHLHGERRAVALDLRGHGHSDPALDGDYSIESMAEDIDDVVNALGLQRFVLVGHSMGGSVSIAYAGIHPEKVAGLLLADPSGDARKVPKEQMIPFLAGLQSDSYARVIEDYWQGILAGSKPGGPGKGLAGICTTPEKRRSSALFARLLSSIP